MPWFILVLVIAAFALVYVQARASWWLAFMIVWVAAAHAQRRGRPGPDDACSRSCSCSLLSCLR